MTSHAYVSLSRTLRTGLVTSLTLLLLACGGSDDDLRAWVDTIKAQPPGRIKPTPVVKEYQPYDYQSSHLKSPFSELEPELETQLQALHDGCDQSIRPDVSRRKEDLERYSLDSMEMVGTLDRPGHQWGLVRMTAGPSRGIVFRVLVGNYMGINHGKIISIEEEKMEITTLVPDSKGCWEKRTVYLALAE